MDLPPILIFLAGIALYVLGVVCLCRFFKINPREKE